MRVKLSNRKLWKEYYAVLSAISVIASFVFLFLKVPYGKELLCCIGFLICLIISFLIVWYRANHIQNAVLNINNSTLEIGLGDIFEEEGFQFITFNEFFLSLVDDVVISSKTLNV